MDAATGFVNKQELVTRLYRERTRFLQVISKLDADELAAPNALGEWSVKDLLAHFIAHEQRALDQLNAARRGEPYVWSELSNDAYNAQQVQVRRVLTSEQMRAAWDESFAQVIASVEALSDADFEPTGSVCILLDDTIDGALANNSYEHYLEHLPEVVHWAKRVRQA